MLANPTSSLALALVLLSGPLAGCLSGDPGSVGSTSPLDAGPDIEIPRPAEGSWYIYTSTDTEKSHNVTVGPVETRTDAWLRERPARLLDITHHWGSYDHEYELEEAVDPWTGLVLSQWADCGSLRSDKEDGCLDDRAAWFGSAHGLPGASGAAPFWGQTLEPSTVNRSLPTVLGPLDTWNVRFTEPSFSEASARACLEVEPVEQPRMEWALALRFTGGLLSFTLCEGVAMPVEYEDHEGNTYRLQDHDTRPGQAPSEARPELSDSPEPPVGLVERTPPVLVEAPEIDPFFPAQEAHEAALERSDPYAALFDSAADAAVFETFYTYEGSHQAGALPTSSDSETWSHSLEAVDELGRLVEVEIEKTERDPPMGDNETTYEIVEESTGSVDGPVPTVDTWSSRQVDVAEAIALGEQLTDRPSDEGMGHWKYRKLQTHSWVPTEYPTRLEGPSLQVWFEVGEPCGGDESLAIYCPYDLVADGPTGAIHRVVGPGDALDENLR